MTWAIKKFALAAGAAALLSGQAVYAAPATSFARVDPLVSLSALGTAQSQAAVCAAGASAAAAGAAVAATQAGPAPGCLLPLTAPQTAPVTPLAGPAAPPGKRIGWLPILLGLLGLAVIAYFIFDDDDDDGGLVPISPA